MFSVSMRLRLAGLIGLGAMALSANSAQAQMRMAQPMMLRLSMPNIRMTGQNRLPFRPPQSGNNANFPSGFNPFGTGPFNANSAFGNSYSYGSLGRYGSMYSNAYLSTYGNPYASSYGNPYLSAYGSPYASSYGNSSAYGNGYGSASGSSGGNYTIESPEVSEQQANLLREKARGERVANRRKIFDEDQYEREHTPSAKQERQRSQQEQLKRSRANPPVTEVWSGKALNDLLADLQMRAVRDRADLGYLPISLNQVGLEHINVSGGAGSMGLLKRKGRLTWPVALDGRAFQPERDRLSALAIAAVSQASFNGRADSDTLGQMTDDLDNLRKRLRGKAQDFPPSAYIDAKVFLNNFDRSIDALAQPDAGDHFTGKYTLRATSVAELVKHMADHGLHFASAVRGDEMAYEALHKALAACDQSAELRTVTR